MKYFFENFFSYLFIFLQLYTQTRRPIRNDPLHPEGTELQAVASDSAAGTSEDLHCGFTESGRPIPTAADLTGHQGDGVVEKTTDGDVFDDNSSENHEG